MSVVPFPKPFRHPPPPDAIPNGRASMVEIVPWDGGWWAIGMDNGGAMMLAQRAPKEQAIEAGLRWVRLFNAELVLRNTYEPEAET